MLMGLLFCCLCVLWMFMSLKDKGWELPVCRGKH